MSKPSLDTFAQPSIRRVTTWVPSMVRLAESRADAGDLVLAADLVEELFSDDRIGAVVDTMCDDLLGRSLEFTKGLGRRSGAAVKALDAGEDWWLGCPEHELKAILQWGRVLGICPWQNRWAFREDGVNRVLPYIEQWHPRHLRYDLEAKTETPWRLDLGHGRTMPITSGDGKWGLYTPFGATRPWVKGAWRGLARWYMLKLFALQDWPLYSERHGGGYLMGVAPEGLSEKLRKELAEDIDSLVANGSITLPFGFDLKIVESTANTYETFVKQIEMADRGFAIALLGHNLTTEAGTTGGTNAAAKAQADGPGLGRTRSNAETLSTALHQHTLTWWAEYNFGDRKLAPWPSWDVEPSKDLDARATTLGKLGDAIKKLADAGLQVDAVALAEEFDLPLADVVDATPPGAIFGYHLEYGVLTLNELRARLGLPPIAGGDEPPKPVADPGASSPQKPAKPPAADGKPSDGTPPADADPAAPADGQPPADPQAPAGKSFDAPARRAATSVPRGLLNGQLYVDAVADHATESDAAHRGLALSELAADIEAAESYDDLRSRLRERFKRMSPDAFARIMERALILSELAGRRSIAEDVSG